MGITLKAGDEARSQSDLNRVCMGAGVELHFYYIMHNGLNFD